MLYIFITISERVDERIFAQNTCVVYFGWKLLTQRHTKTAWVRFIGVLWQEMINAQVQITKGPLNKKTQTAAVLYHR